MPTTRRNRPRTRRPVRVVVNRPTDRLTVGGVLLGLLAPAVPLAAVLYLYATLAS